ncbi:MAG: NAD-dependent epimerase/dehydratase family protein, partial [Planctomycetota bacterium]
RGHDVVGLARSDRSAESLSRAGLRIHRGDISDPQTVIYALDRVDAVIHTAFNHDFSRYVENCADDGKLREAIAAALEGSNRALIATSATTVAAAHGLATEQDAAVDYVPRSASEGFLTYSERGVKASVVRLPPSVHGVGDTAFVPALIALARDRGASAFIGDGANRWPAVHRNDAARLFCDALESSRGGERYHGVAEDGISFRTIAETIGSGLGVSTESVAPEGAEEHFGWLAMFAADDMAASSSWTQDSTGWSPSEVGLIEDMNSGGYFDTPDQ